MRFLVDAQLPRRFASWLKDAGHDSLHTLDLPKKNHTQDSELIARAMQEGRRFRTVLSGHRRSAGGA